MPKLMFRFNFFESFDPKKEFFKISFLRFAKYKTSLKFIPS